MSDKKHIDRLFQEGFKDFEASPNDAVWKNIESKLNDKKKKRRVIPIWRRYASVAALILLFISVARIYFNNEINTVENQVVDTENSVNSELNSNIDNTLNNASESEISTTKTIDSKDVLKTDSEVMTPSNTSSVTATPSAKNNSQSKLGTNKKTNNTSDNSKVNLAIANNTQEKNSNTQLPKNSAHKKHVVSTNLNDNQVVFDSEIKRKVRQAVNDSTTVYTEVAKTNENTSLETYAATKNTKSSTTIEEALDQNKEALNLEENDLKNRWSVAPNIAPVYFNTLGEGSPIDPQFNNSSKTGELNMSYGISASYAVNKKLKVRSGIHKVNLGYTTNDVVSYQAIGLNSSNINVLQNVNSRPGNASNLSLSSFDALNSKDGAQNNLLTSNSTLNQAFGYIEIPLEIQYAISSKRLGLHVIGGFSSLFLDNNEIYSKTDSGPTVFLGEANNINNTSYSANFGIGLNYQVSKKIDFNLEPMFKYQFNTFSNTSGNFTPFFIGVYTGFGIKF